MLWVLAGIGIVHMPYRGSQRTVADPAGRPHPAHARPDRGAAERERRRMGVLGSSGAVGFPGTPDLPTKRERWLPG